MLEYLIANVRVLVGCFLLQLLFLLLCILASTIFLIYLLFSLLISFFYTLLSILHVLPNHIVCGLLFSFVSPQCVVILFVCFSSPRWIYVAKANGYYPPVLSILYLQITFCKLLPFVKKIPSILKKNYLFNNSGSIINSVGE